MAASLGHAALGQCRFRLEGEGGGTLRSALDAVVHVGDTVPLEDPGALELDVLGSEVVEETAPLAEEHRGNWKCGRASSCSLPPACRTCRLTRATARPASPCSRAPIP
jgi:hypothetical protein